MLNRNIFARLDFNFLLSTVGIVREQQIDAELFINSKAVDNTKNFEYYQGIYFRRFKKGRFWDSQFYQFFDRPIKGRFRDGF